VYTVFVQTDIRRVSRRAYLAWALLLLTACSSDNPATDGRLAEGDGPFVSRDRGLDWLPIGDAIGLFDTGRRDALADDGSIDPTKDSDGDGLPDGFEARFENLDPSKKDTDGDGIADGQEDEDQDGLTAKQEWAAWQGGAVTGVKPSPMHADLLIELDYQVSAVPNSAVLNQVAAAYAATAHPNLDGKMGINLMIFIDESALADQPMPESLNGRLDYLGAHGPKKLTGSHVEQMVHVIFATTRPQSSGRGGDTVAGQSVNKSGVLIYLGNLEKLFPNCAHPIHPKVSVQEAIVSTTVHEIGHSLQLGHDTSVGGVNPYNIMSTDLGDCDLLRARTRGIGNQDPALGATESVGAPRFSAAAVKLMKLRNKISVESKALYKGRGYEM
jgi:hypothetical protein